MNDDDVNPTSDWGLTYREEKLLLKFREKNIAGELTDAEKQFATDLIAEKVLPKNPKLGQIMLAFCASRGFYPTRKPAKKVLPPTTLH